MFRLCIAIALLSCISAYYYRSYDYGFDNGPKKEGIHSYRSQPYQPNHYHHNHHNYNHNHDYGYGYGYGYKRFPIVKRLPPIYKDVKQPVIIEQPVIIRKIPVFHKKKEVTVKRLPPVYDVSHKPTVIEKDVGADEKPMFEYEMPGHKGVHMMPDEKISDMRPGVEYERPGAGYERPGAGYDRTRVGYERPGVEYERPGVGYERPGFGYKRPGVGYEDSEVIGMPEMQMKRKDMEKDGMKHNAMDKEVMMDKKPMPEDEGYSDFDIKDFNSSKLKKN